MVSSPTVPGLDGVWALGAYEGTGGELVRGLKYANRRAPLAALAEGLAALLPVAERPDVVTWVPATPAHRRRRGYDQAELLARRVARRLRVPSRALLRRGHDRPQTGLGREARRAGPRLATRGQCPPVVCVVDDVLTTGSSLAAAAHVLREAGGERVLGLVVARA